MENNSDKREKEKIDGYLLDKYKDYFKIAQFDPHKDTVLENVRYEFGQCDDKTKFRENMKMHKHTSTRITALKGFVNLSIHKQ